MSTCTNGPCWTATTINGTFLAQCAGSFNDLWLVGGNNTINGNAAIQYSTDGTTWTTVDLGYLGGIGIKSFSVGNGIVLGQVGGRTHVISTDGISWSVEDHYFGGLPTIFGGGYFVMRGGVFNDSLVYSSTGLTGSWSFTDSAAGAGSYMDRGLTYGNGLYVGMGSSGFCYTDDLATPLTLTPYLTYTASLIAYGNGVFVAIESGLGAGNTVFRSTDGINWTTIPNALPNSTGQIFYNSLVFAQDRFLACKSDSNVLIYSTDGLSWTATSGDHLFDSPNNVGQRFMATDGNGRYMAVNANSTTAQVGICPCEIPVVYGDWWASISNTVIKNTTVKRDPNPIPPEQAILLLPGADNISFNNDVFLDSTGTYYVNRIANATQGTYNPYKSSAYTVGSMYFDGNLDCLYIDTLNNSNNIPAYEPDGLVLQDSWTIESWVYFSDFDPQNWAPHIFSFGSNFPLKRFTLFKNGYLSGQFSFYSRINDNEYLTNCITVPVANTWYHTAVVKNGNTIGIYINGILEATTTDPIDPVCRYLFIATYKDEPPGGDLRNFVKGFISNFRVVNGSAVYTSNFTPPAQPVDIIPGTVLLLNAVNSGVYDQTFNNDIETAGTTARTAGSVYFAGNTDDQLILPANTKYNLGTSDYTIEFWFYKTSARFENVMVMNSSTDFSIGLDTTGFQVALNAAAQTFACSINLNTWYYFSMIRQKGVVRLYLNDTMIGSVISTGQNGYGDKTLIIGGPNPNFTGYIRDFRIVKNRSKPPTPPPPPPTNRYRLAFSAGPTYAPANNSTWSVDLDISPETWNIITITQTPDAKVRFYINAVEVPTLPGSLQQLSGFYPGTQYLGRADNFWWGRIGYWQVYNTALTPAQIAQNFEATKGRFGFPAGSGSVVLENMVLYVDATAGFTPVIGNTQLNNNNVSIVGGNYFDFNGTNAGIDILNPDLYNVPWTAGKTVMMPVWFNRNVQVGYRAMLGAPGVSALQDRIVNVYLEVLPL